MTYTNEEKEKALQERGWAQVEGYLFKVPPAQEDYELTFVHLDDATPVIAAGPQKFWVHEDHDGVVMELNEAWGWFLDTWSDEFDADYPSKGEQQ